jgi:hypothetical protein
MNCFFLATKHIWKFEIINKKTLLIYQVTAVLPIREVTMTRGPRALEGEVRG